MFRREAEPDLHAGGQPLPAATEDSRSQAHEEPDPAVVRWMPVMVPLSAALVLGVVLLIWWTVL